MTTPRPYRFVLCPQLLVCWVLTCAVVACQVTPTSGDASSPDDSGDPQAAHLRRLKEAAEQGDATAQLELAGRYASGEGVTQDLSEAVKWFRIAAEQGDATAQLELAGRYASGEGVTQDLSEAVKWFRMAAENGDAKAQFALYWCYFEGKGVKQDSSEAFRWLHKSVVQGGEHARMMLHLVRTFAYPIWGSVGGGTPITIVGLDLDSTASVTVDGVAAPTFCVTSSTAVTAVTPAGSAGTKVVELRDADGQVIASTSFLYAVTPLSWAAVLEQLPDSTVLRDHNLCAAIAATGLPWRVRDTETQIELVLIPPGTYQRGCSRSLQPGCDCNVELPVHQVTLTEPFYLGRYEVTQAQWTARMGSNPSLHQGASAEVSSDQVPNRPVEQVSWDMIQEFLGATGMRLPTEAEWEYAYRAGTTTAFHSMPDDPNGTDDDALVGTIAWFVGNSEGQTRPVGQKAGNRFGVHDMSGNVGEWLNDWFSPFYDKSSPATNPTGPESGSGRVARGGSWLDGMCHVRSSSRAGYGPGDTHGNIGFRVARTHLGYRPTLTEVSPPSGPVEGGTTVTLRGTNLTSAMSVTVNGVAATDVRVVDSTTVTAVTPDGRADACDVAVTTPAGTATRVGGFTYGPIHVPPWATLIEATPDPAVVTSQSLRSAISATGYAWRVRDTATQIEFVLIPPGAYQRVTGSLSSVHPL